jgi:hypothetical protein
MPRRNGNDLRKPNEGLGPTLEAAQVTRLKELYETANGAAGKHREKSQLLQFAKAENEEPAERFAKIEAENTDKNEATIARATSRGEKLGVEALNKIAGASLDKGIELDALKDMDEPAREALIERAVAVRHQIFTALKIAEPFFRSGGTNLTP